MDVKRKHNITLRGKGEQPIIFAHGYGCDQNMWRHVAPAFENEYSLMLYDLVGSGNSDLSAFNPDKYATLQGWADDLLEICEDLDLRNAIFVGHSVSAMIGLLAAAEQSGVFSDLVMIGPSPCYINDENYVGGFTRQDVEELLETLDANYLGWASAMAPVIMNNSERPELGEELTNSSCRTDPDIAKHFARVTFLSDNRKDLPRLKTSTLILQCSNDVIAPDVVGQYLHQHIQGSVFRQMKAQGHCPHLSEPAETVKLIKEYLAEKRS